MRAVGAANGKNPISIIAPVHRVIGASGALTGFAGGLEAKDYLLSLEGNNEYRPRKTALRSQNKPDVDLCSARVIPCFRFASGYAGGWSR